MRSSLSNGRGLPGKPEFGQELQPHIPDVMHRLFKPFFDDSPSFGREAENIFGRQVVLPHSFVDHETFTFQFG